VSLNEVGGDPERFGVSVEEFHAQCQRRLEQWPDGLNASSTHDTKRGEDVRARISLLSEIPRDWRAAVSRWHRLNQRHLSRVDGQTAPDRNDEYLLYQTLVGSRPLDPMGPDAAAEFTARIQAYMLKATKEAKQNSSWINPNAAYDEAVRLFVARILDPAPANRFLVDFDAFHLPIARLGMVNSLAQTVLKIAAPGVPDFYQGTELWDLRLVDPDNRRPVEFGRRADLLQGLQGRIEAGDLGSLACELMETWEDGRIKLYTIHRLLAVRRAVPELFQRGAYVPLAAKGERADHLCGFARVLGEQALVVVVPRLVARLTDLARLPVGPECWGNTRLGLPADIRARTLRDLLTGEMVGPHAGPGGGELAIAEILGTCPVAVLEARHGRRWCR
jgi:(1->4)-alpha-D-glucan 1-alpha-D-glucosylmutase